MFFISEKSRSVYSFKFNFNLGFKALVLSLLIATFSLFSATFAYAQPTLSLAQFQKKPKLIVVIVIDQFRADYLTRFASRYLPAQGKNGNVGGFQYLMKSSAYFPAAKYEVLQNMTCPGHSMILTGSAPYRMGIPINEWYDRSKKKMRYCVQDDQDQFSPRSIIGDTVGDSLKNSGYPTRVFALALKDRAAIALGGHRADLSFWIDPNGDWSTSSYYSKNAEIPDWLKALNKTLQKTRGQEIVWSVTKPGTGLTIGNGFTRKAVEGSTDSLLMPFGAEITTDAALATVNNEKLGRGKATDILALSYSTHDLIGHKTGPNALEMEEITVAEDKALSRLLNGIKDSVPGGLREVVVVLTADHGVGPSPDYLKEVRMNTGRLVPKLILEEVNKRLREKFGKPKNSDRWMVAEESLNFYFYPDAINAEGVERKKLEDEAKAYFSTLEGVARVFTKSDYDSNLLPPGEFERQIKKSYFPERSGDVVIIPKPFWVDGGSVATHLTGYSYDRNAPLVIAGPNIQAGVYATPADILDLAPTLSFITGTVPPAQSEGRILSEIFLAK